MRSAVAILSFGQTSAIVLTILLTIGLPESSAAVVSCADVFESAERASLDLPDFGPERVHALSKWLKTAATKIDPATTHLEAAVPFVQTLRAKVEEALKNKVGQPRYQMLAPSLKTLLAELDQRIATKSITYDYLFLLPFRIGTLVKMSAGDPYRRTIEHGDVFVWRNYATHEAFSQLVRKAVAHRQGDVRKSAFDRVLAELEAFPSRIYLPVTATLNYRDINLMFARGVYPIGLTFTEKEVDGTKYSEAEFPLHDLGHGELDLIVFFYRAQMPRALIGELEKPILFSVEKTRRISPLEFDLMHFIHFHVFHEDRGAGWLLKTSAGEWAEDYNRETVASGFHFLLRTIEDRLTNPDQEGYGYVRREFRELLARYPNEDGAVVLKATIEKYELIFKEALNRVKVLPAPRQ